MYRVFGRKFNEETLDREGRYARGRGGLALHACELKSGLDGSPSGCLNIDIIVGSFLPLGSGLR